MSEQCYATTLESFSVTSSRPSAPRTTSRASTHHPTNSSRMLLPRTWSRSSSKPQDCYFDKDPLERSFGAGQQDTQW
eukprot:3135756-Rhodomonas_salina.1